jgi:hypothetical protein
MLQALAVMFLVEMLPVKMLCLACSTIARVFVKHVCLFALDAAVTLRNRLILVVLFDPKFERATFPFVLLRQMMFQIWVLLGVV